MQIYKNVNIAKKIDKNKYLIYKVKKIEYKKNFITWTNISSFISNALLTAFSK